ncbi:hypothetical protein FZI91_05055 [Mycobacterium sp. CBMA271]|uniref:hypothetical protein n=1 Tax=unclassified Mycobacteroides TaxID=2618759 RepID=UPI0012DD633E|nr:MULTISPECIES: hypothetical protein [unclassified Mycobacteroides]MUM19774.1 hypothetical protein [Mycobacteroides sp. CBMA 326]MUM21069.1 hypothetical protein [Mycobacteroides sp. CBMA 271]
MSDIKERALTLDDADPDELTEMADVDPTPESKPMDKKAAPVTPSAREVDPEQAGRNIWKPIAIALLILGIAGAVAGFWQYHKTAGVLAATRHAEAERAAATQVASTYAMKSLTYSYEDPDAFFKNVKDGVSEPLKNKYTDAEKLLKAIMLQAQVTSKGEILATEAKLQPGDVYQLVLTTRQTTRNVQNPEPRVTTLVLQVTMNKQGETWQVSDIGPMNGSGAATSIMHPGDQKILPEAPAPLPAPGKPPVQGQR